MGQLFLQGLVHLIVFFCRHGVITVYCTYCCNMVYEKLKAVIVPTCTCIYTIFVGYCCLSSGVMQALIVGSDTAPSVQALIIFPATDSDNTVSGFAALAGGFLLTDSTTSFTFNSFFPVGTAAGFNSGTAYLLQDLTFDSFITISSTGTLEGNTHTVEFAPRADILYFPVAGSTKPFVFSNVDVVFNGPVELTQSIIFNGSCSVTSNGNLINVNNNSIVLTSGAGLTVYNSTLYGMGGGQSVRFLDSTSSITISELNIVNTRDFTLNGPLYIMGDVHISGTYKFIYRTPLQSYIRTQGHLHFDSGVTFSYDPSGGANNLFVFDDPTSELYLYETSSYITPTTGMVLTKGLLTVDGICPLNAPGGLYLGDGTAANNVTLNVLPDSGLIITNGSLISRLTY
jgi:hypothetical protein